MDHSHHALIEAASLAGTRNSAPPERTLREERHPNSVTAPPLNRGAMVPRPWRGFWNSLGTAALLTVAGAERASGSKDKTTQPQVQPQVQAPWMKATNRRRVFLPVATVLSTLLATVLFAHMQPDYDSAWLRYGQLGLFGLLSGWVVTGFLTALMGFYVSIFGDRHALSVKQVLGHSLAPGVRTAIVMPICNEDVTTVFAGLRATCESVATTGHAGNFDVFVLSDSADPALQRAERAAWEALRASLAAAAGQGQPQVEVYYRLRKRRTDRKAGNVADFCRRWGKDYRYMVVLDADSVMSGDCLVNMAKLMEANPRAGIIQTATQAIGHVTLHARTQQFASRVTGRLFTLGMQFWQMGESHYWGHNAIIRVEPFMKHCALAHIPGTGGMSGSIMSHDFVEAALMRRAGYYVWLVADLAGSYEQQPPDLLAELQRDRRWCQGNLQNARLIAEPGIHRVHRCMFGTGAMSYLSAPLWLCFLTLGTTLWMLDTPQMVQAWDLLPAELIALWMWTLSMLFLPRILGLVAVFMRHEQHSFGGAAALLRSALLETGVALLQAPVRMVAHSLFVVAALTGLKLDWKSPPREASVVPWATAVERFAPQTVFVGVLASLVAAVDPRALVWLMPVGLPLLLAIPVTVLTSQTGLGTALKAQGYLLIPEEARSPAVLRRAWLHARGLTAALRMKTRTA